MSTSKEIIEEISPKLFDTLNYKDYIEITDRIADACQVAYFEGITEGTQRGVERHKHFIVEAK